MTQRSASARFVATLLVAALLHGAFGQAAWAQVVSLGSVWAPVGGSVSAAAAGTAGIQGAGLLSPALPSAQLTGGLSSVVSPQAAPIAAAPAAGQAIAGVGSARTAAATAAPRVGAAASPAASNIAPVAANDSFAARAADAVASTLIPGSLRSGSVAQAAGALASGRTVAALPQEKPAQATSRVAGFSAKVSERFAQLKRLFGGKSVDELPVSGPVAAEATAKATPAQGLTPAAPRSAETQSGQDARAPLAPATTPAATAASASTTPAAEPRVGAAEPRVGAAEPRVGAAETGKKGKGWFGLGAVVAAFIGGLLIMQFGLEAQGAAMAQLTEQAFGDFSILAQVTIFAQIGSMIGQQLSQFFSSKFGLTKAFYAAQALRAVSLGTMVFLLGTGAMPLALMFVFYAFNGMVTGISVTAEGTLRKFLLAQQGVSQQKFRTWWQLLAEIIAVPAPMVLGAMVPVLGASLITGLYPATILVALMLFLALKVLPWSAAKRIEARIAAQAQAPAPQVGAPAAVAPAPVPEAPQGSAWQRLKNAFKQIFSSMEEGKNFVLRTPILKYSFLGAIVFDLMNLIIYRLIAPGYGKLVAGSAGMAAVQGNIVGMFSLGGLILAAVFLLMERHAKKAEAGKSAGEAAASERSSLLRWTLLGVPALALLGVMAFNLALPFAPVLFMGVNWVPSTVLAAMMIPFGFFQVAASIKLNSYYAEKLPQDPSTVTKAFAFSGSAMTALSIVLMLALKPLFSNIGVFNPFPWMAAALIPVALAVFVIQRKLAAATKPDAPQPTPGEPGKTTGGYVGLLLGVVAAALALTAVPFIPGLSGLIAALGVLGKFAFNLGVALALPAAGYLLDKLIRRRRRSASAGQVS